MAAALGQRPTRARLVLCAWCCWRASVLLQRAGTRDYLAWNRVRWKALNDLLADGKVTAADVDGGFEFNGWYLYDPAYQAEPGKSWYWVNRDSYLLAFAEMPGRSAVREYPYPHWLPPYTGKIVGA